MRNTIKNKAALRLRFRSTRPNYIYRARFCFFPSKKNITNQFVDKLIAPSLRRREKKNGTVFVPKPCGNHKSEKCWIYNETSNAALSLFRKFIRIRLNCYKFTNLIQSSCIFCCWLKQEEEKPIFGKCIWFDFGIRF